MSLKVDISRAIAAHGDWKARLEEAIATGHCAEKPAQVRQDDQCELGRWLHGPGLAEREKHGPYYEAVRALHADYHRVTAEVLLFALVGKTDMARKMMETGSHYSSLSAELTRLLTRWRDASR